jgi:hypothetical protein
MRLSYCDTTGSGIVVIDNVLTSSELAAARLEIKKLLDSDTNFETNGHKDEAVRNDLVLWISESLGDHESKLGSGLLTALRLVRSIPLELEEYGYKNSILGVPFENQLACYDAKNARYIAHRDCPERNEGEWSHPLYWLLKPGLEERIVTIILYLNQEQWDSNADGMTHNGDLICYMNANPTDFVGGTATDKMYIAPCGGRMVIFDSKKVLHEVGAYLYIEILI